MRVVVDIPDETFINLPEHSRHRVARYLRIVASQIAEDGSENSGLAPITPHSQGTPHVAGWAVEGSPWQKSSLDNEKEV
jgi:hypothetical protein